MNWMLLLILIQLFSISLSKESSSDALDETPPSSGFLFIIGQKPAVIPVHPIRIGSSGATSETANHIKASETNPTNHVAAQPSHMTNSTNHAASYCKIQRGTNADSAPIPATPTFCLWHGRGQPPECLVHSIIVQETGLTGSQSGFDESGNHTNLDKVELTQLSADFVYKKLHDTLQKKLLSTATQPLSQLATQTLFQAIPLHLPPTLVIAVVVQMVSATRSYWLPTVGPPFSYVGKQLDPLVPDVARKGMAILEDVARKTVQSPFLLFEKVWRGKAEEAARNMSASLLASLYEFSALRPTGKGCDSLLMLRFNVSNEHLKFTFGSDYVKPKLIWTMSNLPVSVLITACESSGNGKTGTQKYLELPPIHGMLNVAILCDVEKVKLADKHKTKAQFIACYRDNMAVNLLVDETQTSEWSRVVENELPDLLRLKLQEHLHDNVRTDQWLIHNWKRLPNTRIVETEHFPTSREQLAKIERDTIKSAIQVVKKGLFDDRFMSDFGLQNFEDATLTTRPQWSTIPKWLLPENIRKVSKTKMWLSKNNTLFNLEIKNQMFRMSWNSTENYAELLADIDAKCLLVNVKKTRFLECPLDNITLRVHETRGLFVEGKAKQAMSAHYSFVLRHLLQDSLQRVADPSSMFVQEHFEFRKLLDIWTSGVSLNETQPNFFQKMMCSIKDAMGIDKAKNAAAKKLKAQRLANQAAELEAEAERTKLLIAQAYKFDAELRQMNESEFTAYILSDEFNHAYSELQHELGEIRELIGAIKENSQSEKNSAVAHNAHELCSADDVQLVLELERRQNRLNRFQESLTKAKQNLSGRLGELVQQKTLEEAALETEAKIQAKEAKKHSAK